MAFQPWLFVEYLTPIHMCIYVKEPNAHRGALQSDTPGNSVKYLRSNSEEARYAQNSF